jgi:hypothetical protein
LTDATSNDWAAMAHDIQIAKLSSDVARLILVNS